MMEGLLWGVVDVYENPGRDEIQVVERHRITGKIRKTTHERNHA